MYEKVIFCSNERLKNSDQNYNFTKHLTIVIFSQGRLAPVSFGPLQVRRNVLVHGIVARGLLSGLRLGSSQVRSHL